MGFTEHAEELMRKGLEKMNKETYYVLKWDKAHYDGESIPRVAGRVMAENLNSLWALYEKWLMAHGQEGFVYQISTKIGDPGIIKVSRTIETVWE